MKYRKVNYKSNWDWLIILDSARYDFFAKLWDKTDVEPVLSIGSCTLEVLNNFPRLESSICVTGHPFVLMHSKPFDKVWDVGFNYRLGTTPPWDVNLAVELYIDEIRKYRRRVIWYLQPHYPFIGDTKFYIPIFEDKEKGVMPPQKRIEELYKIAKLRGILEKAYEDNLRLVLKFVDRLLRYLDGTVVITADHGDGLGLPLRKEDKPVFAHPCERRELELRLIPWVVIR